MKKFFEGFEKKATNPVRRAVADIKELSDFFLKMKDDRSKAKMKKKSEMVKYTKPGV